MNEIITHPINNKPIYLKKVNFLLQYKNHHVRTNTTTAKDHNKNVYRKLKSSKTKHKNLHK